MRKGLFLLAILLLLGCQPRGEAHSLDEVLGAEKSRFVALSKASSLPPDILKNIDAIRAALDDLSTPWSSSAVVKEADTVARSLSVLLPHAGVTSRPAFDEIMREFQVLTLLRANDDVRLESSRIRLLVARTYGILSGELSSRGFSL